MVSKAQPNNGMQRSADTRDFIFGRGAARPLMPSVGLLLMVSVVKKIIGHRVRVGGTQHSGWLPEGAATPPPTPARDVAFNLEIQFDGSGYLLCYASEAGDLYGDTWHETLDDAEEQAAEWFGVEREQWQEV